MYEKLEFPYKVTSLDYELRTAEFSLLSFGDTDANILLELNSLHNFRCSVHYQMYINFPSKGNFFTLTRKRYHLILLL